jgi:predicted secreted protein
MQPGSAFAIYSLFWMLTLFAVLPWGVRTSDEAGQARAHGEADSAPSNPMIKRKLVWTTLISAVLFGLFWANYDMGWLTLDDIPGWG